MKPFQLFLFLCFLTNLPLVYSQEKLIFDENELQVNWQLITNNHNKEKKVATFFQITNKGKTLFPASGWTIYFNYSKKVAPGLNSDEFVITHLNGDLSQMKPTPKFQGLKPNQTTVFTFLSEGKILNHSAAPSGIYIVWDSIPNKGYRIKNYVLKPITDSTVNYRTSEITYNNNNEIEDISLENLPKIFPTPKYFKANQGGFVFDKTVTIDADAEFLNEAQAFSKEWNKMTGNEIGINTCLFSTKKIVLKKVDLAQEEYILDVQSDKIEISAANAVGVFYGIQSLKSMFPTEYWSNKLNGITIANCYVKDAPRFEFRSLMLDVARNFQTKETVFKILDLMSLYKMNTLHFHFSDDEGWRIAISSLPELTEVGGNRGHTLDSKPFLPPSYGSGPDIGVNLGSGFYSKHDFIEILKYANSRHIAVIPEIESPGHSRAAIKAMDLRYDRLIKAGSHEEAERYLLRDINDKSIYTSAQLWTDNVMCVAMPSTYNFLEKVIDELLAMYSEAGAPLLSIHLGGDEVPQGAWKLSPLCNKLIAENSNIGTTDGLWYYYLDRMEGIMTRKKLVLSGWEEIAMRKTVLDGRKITFPNPDFANKGFRAHVWNNGIGWGSEDLPYKLANAGYKVVLSCVSNLYFDLAYEKSADEPGYYWAGFNDIDKPFYFIPFDYYKNTKEDINGISITAGIFKGKERLTDYGKSNVLGIQGQLFGENCRDAKTLEYLLLPKLFALAERAWAISPAWATEIDESKSRILYKKDWSVFVNILGKKELPRLDYYSEGFEYRIPPVGAILENGTVRANIQIPGLTIRYTTDGSEPTKMSPIYKKPIAEKGKIILTAFSTNGRKGKLTIIENK